jgi:hypothetical protein
MQNIASDFSKSKFKGLNIGDEITARGILTGISNEPLVWKLIESNLAKTDLIFEVSDFGVFVGEYGVKNGEIMEL